jgi:hypothetical protein
MSSLLIPFAKRCSDDLLVSPDEVPRGLACNCVCPACSYPVQAHQGTEKAWYFAHTKGSDCAEAYEISVHEKAKQLLKERKKLLVPALVIVESAQDILGQVLVEREIAFESKTVALGSCKSGKVVQDVSPDILGELNGHRVIVEITVFHRLMPEKRERIQNTGLASVEIDLSRFKSTQATQELLERELFFNPDNRRWICHPRQHEVSEKLRAQLQVKVEQSKVQAEAWAAAKAKRDAADAAQRALRAESTQLSRRHEFRPVADEELEWRASFPSRERWQPARLAFSNRHGVSIHKVEEVMSRISKRSHLAETNPTKLAAEWSDAFAVSTEDIYLYFSEAGYTLT